VRFPALALLSLLLLAPTAPAAGAGPAPAAPAAAAARQIAYHQWDDGGEWRDGTLSGVRVGQGRLVIKAPEGTRRYQGTTYDVAHWDSPWVRPGFDLTRLVGSWSATTPGDSWVEVRVRGRSSAGRTSSWDVLARWTAGDRYLQRATVSGQADDLASVDVDTWQTAGLRGYQLRVTLLRRTGTTYSPAVDAVGAVASRLPAGAGATSAPGPAAGTTLAVPRFSQMAHRGHFPRWGGGGEAWCSPTSTSMVLAYYDALPRKKAYAWVGAGHTDPWVDLAARRTYDYAYDGAGNWPFNTAYAAPLAGHAFVTRLRSLREAERFIVAGIPVVASIAFGPGELDGAPISSTAGHLLVIVGFTKSGDPVVNDPAASTRSGVRRVYDRGQLERAWLEGSGGTAYVIHDDAHPLPEGKQRNW
jgi:hypothetical protein